MAANQVIFSFPIPDAHRIREALEDSLFDDNGQVYPHLGEYPNYHPIVTFYYDLYEALEGH